MTAPISSDVNADVDPRPEPPEKPIPSDCCGGGCDPCVLESYEDDLAYYRQALEAWLLRHPSDRAAD